MGGSRERDVPSNIVVLCANLNGLIESDQVWAEVAVDNGWKLRSGQNPLESPYFDLRNGRWFYVDNLFNRIAGIPSSLV
jgi:hypothetical protein